ncbi:MAG: esterase/lipase family protein [Solirubrobacteraceae bacterium]
MSPAAASPEDHGPGPGWTETLPPELPADGRPWWGHHLAETRWSLELIRLLVDPVFLPAGVPRGDGRAVVLLPGFGAGDNTLMVLAAWLWRLGYEPYTCGFLANVDCSDRAIARVERKIGTLCERSGRRVAVIGHSRGGHFSRAVAARRPDAVSHAISAGADLRGLLGVSIPTRYAVAGARRALRLARRAGSETCLSADCACSFVRDYSREFPSDRVRLTSIYSKGDGATTRPRNADGRHHARRFVISAQAVQPVCSVSALPRAFGTQVWYPSTFTGRT